MTTFDERIRALAWGRQLLEELASSGEANVERELASLLLLNYPAVADIEARLEPCRGYALLLAVRSFDRTSGLLERLIHDADESMAERAMRIARHFPERHELALAVRTPYDARFWAALHLDRPPGRSALLRCDRPTGAELALTATRRRQRREALGQLGSVLRRLQRDPSLTPFALSEVQQVLARLPSRRLMGRRFQGEGLRSLNACLRILQRGCQIVEAVVDDTFAASCRSRALAWRVGRHLPAGEWFPFNAASEGYRQEWLDGLFLRTAPRSVHSRSKFTIGGAL